MVRFIHANTKQCTAGKTKDDMGVLNKVISAEGNVCYESRGGTRRKRHMFTFYCCVWLGVRHRYDLPLVEWLMSAQVGLDSKNVAVKGIET